MMFGPIGIQLVVGQTCALVEENGKTTTMGLCGRLRCVLLNDLGLLSVHLEAYTTGAVMSKDRTTFALISKCFTSLPGKAIE
jgi:hypothetical protein